MRYVLDASVGLKTVLVEAGSHDAEALLDDYAQGAIDLIAPDTFLIETAHALTRAERRGLVADASAALHDVIANSPILLPYPPLLWRAVEIARRARISVYDCLYVALAEREGCDLVTADQRLINALQADFPFVRDLASL